MSKQHIIVAGGGCAGLAMAWQLARRASNDLHITVVDPELSKPPSKTWSFWGQVPVIARRALSRSWTNMRIAFSGWERTEPLTRCIYHSVRAADYHRFILDYLHHHPRVNLVQDRVGQMFDLGQREGAFVEIGGKTQHARWVFQSCKHPLRENGDRPLLQQFGGWEIETEIAQFDPSSFTLMDFAVDQRGQTRFFYILPFSPRRALIEHTTFSTRSEPYLRDDRAVIAYIEEHIKGSWRKVRSEYGTIPMEVRHAASSAPPSIFSIGAAGGMTKASTGYTFVRTQRQVTHLVDTLLRHGIPEPLPAAPARFARFDRALLDVLAAAPEQGSGIFEQLFLHNRFDDILLFLAERTGLWQELGMLVRLPWQPFLAKLLRPSCRWSPSLPAAAG